MLSVGHQEQAEGIGVRGRTFFLTFVADQESHGGLLCVMRKFTGSVSFSYFNFFTEAMFSLHLWDGILCTDVKK